jgi:hypothetical protein
MAYRQGVLRALLTRLRAWWRREAIADAEISREVVDHRRLSDTEYTELGGKL